MSLISKEQHLLSLFTGKPKWHFKIPRLCTWTT